MCRFDNVAIVPSKSSWLVEESVLLLPSLASRYYYSCTAHFRIIWLQVMAIGCGIANFWFPYQTLGMKQCTFSND